MNRGLLVLVQELDRVLDREDVDRALSRSCDRRSRRASTTCPIRSARSRARCRCAAARCPASCGGRPQVVERRDPHRDDAHDDGARRALAEDVDAKARDARQRVGQVRRSVLLELLRRQSGWRRSGPRRSRIVCCGVSRSSPSNGSSMSSPRVSICGARPGEKIRSQTFSRPSSMAVMRSGVATRAVTGAEL